MKKIGFNLLGPGALALLVSAGQIKGNPLLAWLPLDLTLLAAIAVLLACIISRINSGPTVGYIAIPITLWVLFMPSIALSHFDYYASMKITTLFTISVILAIAPFYLLREHSQRKAFLTFAAGIAILVSITALFMNPATASEYNNRLILDGSNTIGTGRTALTGAIIMAIIAFISLTATRTRLMLLAGTLLTAALGVMTGSVGPVTTALFALLAVMFFSPSFKGQRIRSLAGLTIIATSTIGVATAWGSDGINRIINTVSGEASSSSNARIQLWEDSLKQISANPLGLGWGMYDLEYTQHQYPHNLLLEVGVEAGWLPMLVLFLLVVATLVRGARVATEPVMTTFLGLYIFSVLNSMVSGDVNGTRLIWVTMFAIWVVPMCQRDIIQNSFGLASHQRSPQSLTT